MSKRNKKDAAYTMINDGGIGKLLILQSIS